MEVMVVAPHPDDESIGCGGAIALHRLAGDPVTVVFLTSGEAGLPQVPPLDAQLRRELEACAACEELGVRRWHFLRHPDARLSEQADAATSQLRKLLQKVEPALLYVPHPGEWHPDHQAAARIARTASGKSRELLGYEVWTPLDHYDRATDISNVMDRKLRAIRCHRSQLQDIEYDQAARGLNRYRGAFACRSRYAEVFQALR